MLKHTIYLIIISACCCFTNNINAQSAPGLLGKRITVSYDFNTHFNYSAPNLRINENESALFDNSTFVNKHLFGVDYVLSRTMSIGIDYGFHNERLNDVEIQDNDFMHRVRTNETGLRLKVFPFEKGGIAPIGYYFQVRALRYSYRSEMELVPRGSSTLEEPFVFAFEDGVTYTGAFGFGRQGILFGNVMYNVGSEMTLVLTENAFLDLYDASLDLRNSLIIGNLFKLKIGIAVPIY